MRPLALALLTLSATACHCGGKLEQVADGFEVSPSELDFGTLKVHEAKTELVTISNRGKLSFTVTPRLESSLFSTPPDPITVAAGASVDLGVSFTPDGEGTFTETLDLVVGSSSLRVDLKGAAKGGVTSCNPLTCDTRTCGSLDDGCGHTLDCGTCTGSLSCDQEVGACLCPGAGRESCGNGTDDDCDGAVDCADSDCAGLAACAAATCTTGTEVKIATAGGAPDIAWSGNDFGITWMINDVTNAKLDFSFARLDAAGAITQPPTQITTSGLMAHPPRIAWNSEWAIASSTLDSMHTMNLIEVRRLSAQGQPVGTSLVLGAGWPASIASRPGTNDFGILWGSTLKPTFSEVSAGQRIGVDKLIPTTTTWIDYGDLVWSGSGWGAVWTQTVNNMEATAWFARLDATGALVGNPVQLSTPGIAYGGMPRIAWSGTTYGVTWVENSMTSGARFARFDASGAQLGTTLQLGATSGRPDLVWAGTAFALVWEDSRTVKPSIWLSLIDALGRSVGNDRQVSCGTAGSHYPSVAYTGSALGIAWHDDRNGTADIYFKREVP